MLKTVTVLSTILGFLLLQSPPLHADVDPDLKPGFPVKAIRLSGFYFGGSALHTLVGNIDDEPDLEILVTGISSGPLYAWKSSGALVPGWPSPEIGDEAFPAIGNLSDSESFVVASVLRSPMVALSGSGALLPGWPVSTASTWTAAADLDGDGRDEILIGNSGEHRIEAYYADGTPVPGWPVTPGGFITFGPLAIGDLDGDGQPEIVTIAGPESGGKKLYAYHSDGTPVAGFPVTLLTGLALSPVVIGDVDGDGVPEIVTLSITLLANNFDYLIKAALYAPDGSLKREIVASRESPASFSAGVPALADLDGDGIPEIVVQTGDMMHVWKGDGTDFPGWPIAVPGGSPRNVSGNSPVVGDVDGDGLPDIVITTPGKLYVYNRNGVLQAGFPKIFQSNNFNAITPAIADLDLDGRNEIIVTGDGLGTGGLDVDKVWVYDLGGPPHGPVLWGQFMGGPQHQGYLGNQPPSFWLTVQKTGTGGGLVTSDQSGIGCGSDCGEKYPGGSHVTLSAAAESNSVFAGWSGACAGVGPCTVDLTNNRKVTAQFTKIIQVAAPSSGAIWPIGSKQTLRWSKVSLPNTGNFTIELSRDDGNTWLPIVKKLPKSSSKTWKVSGPPTTAAKIRICSIANPSLCDISAPFTIQ